ncbi:MAG: lon2, partial [Firmicutes bacterium]|nr:lon2 [Bacillota bacterium]
KNMDVEVIPVETLQEVLQYAMVKTSEPVKLDVLPAMPKVLAAAGVEKV